MQFSALDPAQIMALMGAGGLFALAGLWLMFRPKVDGHAAKIELFGMKFESSSAGLLVFLIGAAFLAAPLFVPEAGDPPVAGVGSGRASVTGSAAVPSGVTTSEAQPASVLTSPARAITAVGDEVEPNDNIAEANEIEVGSVIHGEVSEENADFYTFTFPDDFVGRFTVNLSANTNTGFTLYDDLGGRITDRNAGQPISRETEHTRYYVSVGTPEKRASYNLTVAAREE